MPYHGMDDQPVGMKIVGYTKHGRPIIENMDGSLSIDGHATVEVEPGEWMNIPLLVLGVPMTPDEALELVRREGYRDFDTMKPLERYKSKTAAVKARTERRRKIDGLLRVVVDNA